MEGFQLWLNLAAKDKMRAPWYRDIQSADIPEFTTQDGVTVRVIAGASHGVAGAVQRETTMPLFLDLHLAPGAIFAQSMPPTFNAFIFVYRGEFQIEGKLVPNQRMAILKNDTDSDGVVMHAEAPTRALLIAGQPLREPIVQYGPFVMNTQAEIFKAINDFNEGRLVSAK